MTEGTVKFSRQVKEEEEEDAMIQTLALHRNTVLSERIGLLYHDEPSCWDTLEDIRESIFDSEGQFISLDLAEPQTETLPEMLYAALKHSRWEQSLQFSLPSILQNNPHAAPPFINRAILWQRLCDLLIIDDDSSRETVLVLENADQASPAAQREIARLIRYHETHSLHRTFIFTLDRYPHDQIIPELRDIIL